MSSEYFAKYKADASRLLPGTILLLYGLCALGYLMVISWNRPVLDLYAFRQTQTALSAYWIAKGGPLFAYLTPVTGSPWSIPFEFPIYQWIVALLGDLTGLSIDQSGRIASVVFFLAAAATVYRIAVRLSSDRGLSLACAGAFIASPMAIFWARSVMMESTVLFFSLAFLDQIAKYHLDRKTKSAIASVLFAISAALVKITTFYGFAVVLAITLVVALGRDFKSPEFKRTLRTSTVAGVSVLLALIFALCWLDFSDGLKQQAAIGGLLTTRNVSAFTYGTLQQRLNLFSWGEIIFGRAIHDILWSRWVFLFAAGVLACDKSLRWTGLLLLAGYLAPFMTFTNLHYVHTYYQFANFAFLTTAVGLTVGSIAKKGSAGAIAAAAAAIVIAYGSWSVLSSRFIPLITEDQDRGRTIELARFVRAHTKEDEDLLIFGLDWSSAVPYYATRKAVVVPDWIPIENLRSLLDFRRDFGTDTLGAMIVCPGPTFGYSARRPVYDAIISKYSKGRSSQLVGDCQVYF